MKPVSSLSSKSFAEAAGVWCMRLSEGPLEKELQTEFEAWLAADPRHGPALNEAVATWRELEGAESGADFLPLRVEALQALRRRSRRLVLPNWGQAAAMAAAVAILGGVGLWLLSRPTIYETGVGERRVVVLSDGSKMSLDAATRIDVNYRRDKRSLRLEHGRAKFEVAKDPLRPFAVAAADKTVVATGTQFSVELLRRQVRVVLYEGHVAVLNTVADRRTADPVRLVGKHAPADQVLTPGRELVVAQDGSAPATVASTDTSRALAWEGGQLVFVDEPLATAVERVNRYSEAKVEVGDAAAAQVQITGVFTAGDTRAFIEGVTAVFPVEARQRGQETVLIARAKSVG